MNSGTNILTAKKLSGVLRKKGSKVDPAMQDRFQEGFVKLTLACAILPSIVELYSVLLFDSRDSDICVKFGQAKVKDCQDKTRSRLDISRHPRDRAETYNG
jgi:hypothetical protein